MGKKECLQVDCLFSEMSDFRHQVIVRRNEQLNVCLRLGNPLLPPETTLVGSDAGSRRISKLPQYRTIRDCKTYRLRSRKVFPFSSFVIFDMDTLSSSLIVDPSSEKSMLMLVAAALVLDFLLVGASIVDSSAFRWPLVGERFLLPIPRVLSLACSLSSEAILVKFIPQAEPIGPQSTLDICCEGLIVHGAKGAG
jgi:hypothetical protein